jgi:hypothetical protein
MKRTLYSAILAAAVFAAAADTRAQTNVYSLNAGSFLFGAELKTYPVHELLLGPDSNQYGFRESRTDSTCSVDFIHERSVAGFSEWNATSLARLSLHPLRLRMAPSLAASISLLVLCCLWPLLFRRNHKDKASASLAHPWTTL